MVSTRHHPRSFPEPTPSPTKASAPVLANNPVTVTSGSSPRKRQSTQASAGKPAAMSTTGYSHKIPPLLIIWLFVSLPLVIWDTTYIALRPHSMPGGWLHSPLWVPYALYGTVDYVYGWPAWNGHVGFTAAQASLNAVETVMCIYYLAIVLSNGAHDLFTSQTLNGFFKGEGAKAVRGAGVSRAVVVLFSATVMTLSKTVLYCKLFRSGGLLTRLCGLCE